MNIFVLDFDPVQAARYLCSKHVVKMAVETLQILTTAVIQCGADQQQLPLTKSGTPVKQTHINHPSCVWSRQTQANFDWVCEHGKAICSEYTYRYNKQHFCEAGIHKLSALRDLIPSGELQEFAIAINDSMICRTNPNFESMSAVEKYREYYRCDKLFTDWGTKRTKPEWML